MRVVMLALLAVCVAVPAAAAKKRTVSEATFASFEACEEKAAAQGLVHGQSGHIEFVRQCMGMKPGSYSSPRN